MTCDAILCVYGKGWWTWQALQSLWATAPVERVIIIDNGADHPGKTHERLGRLPHVEVVPNENRGCNAAYNEAWRRTTQRHVIVAGTDSIFLPGWWDACRMALEQGGLAWIAPAQRHVDAWTPMPAWEVLRQELAECRIGEFLSGTILMDRWTLRDAVGDYDERFFLAYGDMDYQIRMEDAGVRYGVVHPPRVVHLDFCSRWPLTAEENVWLETLDEQAFHEKYRHRPEVLARFPPLPPPEERLVYWRDRGLL